MTQAYFSEKTNAAKANPLRRTGIRVFAAATIAVLLAGCSGIPSVTISVNTATRSATTSSTAPAVAVKPTAVPNNIKTAPSAQASAGSTSSSVPAATAQPEAAKALPATTNVSNAVTDAIKSVIQLGNQEEVKAIANHDVTVMRDTATSSYYTQLTQTYNDLVNSGVTAIKLDKLVWGKVTLQGTTGAQATTIETWSTKFSDGSTLQETDTNVYTLVLQGSTWLVQNDQYPNTRPQPSTSGNTGTTNPSTPLTPAASTGSIQSQSRNWSGYNATTGTFTSVSGTWKVPSVNTGSTGADATWIGIGGVKATDLIQAGTQAVVQSGQVAYSAWWETLPQSSQTVPLNINAGDTVSVTISQQTSGKWQITMVDQTTGDSYSRSVTYKSSLSSAEWVEEAPAVGRGSLLPLDNFGTVAFSNATAIDNGKQLTLEQTGAKPVTMYGSSGQALAQPSVIGTDGSSFTVSRTSASSSFSLGPGIRSRSRYQP